MCAVLKLMLFHMDFSSKETLSSDSAMAVARYLAAHHAFSQCADICLMQVTPMKFDDVIS